MRCINQYQLILDYISLHSSITVADAVKDLRINALPSKILELCRAGYPIVKKSETSINRYNKPIHYTRYFIDKGVNE